ncbi:MAG: ferrochelatase [Kiloniellaceae bacterium]
MSKVAVILFNLGGPDRLDAVRPFLLNLFDDRAIIAAPRLVRWLLARFISWRRAPVARRIYATIGGGSPLLANTQAQAAALEAALACQSGEGPEFKVYIAMRYWHPRSDEAAAAVKAYGAERIVLLPLYPQFSTTTTGSSVADWTRAAARARLVVPTTTLCCYPSEPGFVAEVAAGVRAALQRAKSSGRPRVLFSAHGLPRKIVAGGDPYPWQVERSVAAVLDELGIPDLDWRICYQSRVGRLEWIGPGTDAEIARAGREGVPVVVVPIAFVSEHSETLVELDIDYRQLARESGVPAYERVPTVADGPRFIEGLARLVRAALAESRPVCSGAGGRTCPADRRRCLHSSA